LVLAQTEEGTVTPVPAAKELIPSSEITHRPQKRLRPSLAVPVWSQEKKTLMKVEQVGALSLTSLTVEQCVQFNAQLDAAATNNEEIGVESAPLDIDINTDLPTNV
jgi:hypothetical protein